MKIFGLLEINYSKNIRFFANNLILVRIKWVRNIFNWKASDLISFPQIYEVNSISEN